MPCEHHHHQDIRDSIDCSLQRIADALEAIYEKIPDVAKPEDFADFVKKTEALLKE